MNDRDRMYDAKKQDEEQKLQEAHEIETDEDAVPLEDCSECGEEFEESELDGGVCYDCIQDTEDEDDLDDGGDGE